MLEDKNITVSGGLTRTARHLQVTPTMVDDFLIDPVMGAHVIFGIKLDVFQAVRQRLYWWTPDMIDSSGLGTGKSLSFFLFMNLRCTLIGDQHVCTYYQRFQSMKDIYWPYYDSFNASRAPIFAAQLGHRDMEGDVTGKDKSKGPACYQAFFKNESINFGPAPDWIRGATGQAGLTFNVVGVDEWTKVESMSKSGRVTNEKGFVVSGIDQQVIGRVRRKCYNQNHPLWCNHRLFLATAESLRHPSYENYRKHLAEAEAGNPGYAVFTSCFKDFSNLPTETDIRIEPCICKTGRIPPDNTECPLCHGEARVLTSTKGKSFRETIPDWKTLFNLHKRYTHGHWMREGLGIWARETQGWYSENALNRCVEAGLGNGLEPECGRAESRPDLKDAFYFMGIDPAPAQGRKSDDGGLAVLRVRPRPGLATPPTSNVADWLAEFVWAYRVRGEVNKSDDAGVWQAQRTRDQAGIIHKKHRQFNLAGIMMDTQGGGLQIWPELNKTRQTIDGIEQECVPIAAVSDTSVGNAHFILMMFVRDSLAPLWPLLQPGVDSLYTAMHTAFQEAVEHGEVGFPLPFNERPRATTEGWGNEKEWALKNLDAARLQLCNVQAATLENGAWDLTRNGAKKFSAAAGKKDLAYACVYAYVRFLLWLKMGELEFMHGDDGEAGVYLV